MFEVLREQHAQLEALARELDARLAAHAPAGAPGGATPAQREELDRRFRQLAERVAAHAAMEERVFYPAVRRRQLDETLVDARHEHGPIKRALERLYASGVGHECFREQLAELAGLLRQHGSHEEEAVLFPKVRPLFSEDELVALGRDAAALYDQLLRRPERAR